jgi:hypothetical protein
VTSTPIEARTWILDKATAHLSEAVDELLIGIRWLDVVEAGSADRAREAIRVVTDFADHASELLSIVGERRG